MKFNIQNLPGQKEHHIIVYNSPKDAFGGRGGFRGRGFGNRGRGGDRGGGRGRGGPDRFRYFMVQSNIFLLQKKFLPKIPVGVTTDLEEGIARTKSTL